MKLRSTSLIAIFMVLFIANAGIVQAAILACQNKCEQTRAQQTDVPECCRGMMATGHLSAGTDNHSMSPDNCPHVDSNSKISDLPTLLALSTKVPTPTKSPALNGIAQPPLAQLPDIQSRYYQSSPDLPPPDIVTPPAYRLFCSLLI